MPDGPAGELRADVNSVLDEAEALYKDPHRHPGLPVQEQTGLDDASTVEGAMHACGHDMHVAWLTGAAAHLSAHRDGWRGTVMAVFQPAEETAAGARAMIDDRLFERFPAPDVIVGQHVMPTLAGSIGTRQGVMRSAGDTFHIRLFGRGAHGSMPQASNDPVVMAAAPVIDPTLRTSIETFVTAACAWLAA